MARAPWFGLALLLGTACALPGNPSGDDPPAVRLEVIAVGLDYPVFLTAPAGDARLFVIEKAGRVQIIRGGRVLDEPFLDVSALVSTGSEQGLLSLAFHPSYATNGRFFVNYTDRAGDTQIVEYRVSADPDRAAPAPVGTILSIVQPYSNHNGGLILFGPDGMLYIGMGDGGSGGDPQGNAQNRDNLLGDLLRIDVDRGAPYTVPADNPFVGRPGSRGEIWATGLRNPWRFSFDRETGDLYIADVGQNRLEEINAVSGAGRGLNYGWNVMEGRDCFRPSEGCDRSGLTLPVAQYDHGDGCSVTGDYVYRGSTMPALRGLYFYSDYCSGFVRSFRFAGGTATDLRQWTELEPSDHAVVSFGEDAAGELYLLTAGGGVYKVVPGP
ncbi:MAG: sorbosone dehydrogenase family protein [Gemmatimonadota bacterium]